MGIGGPAQPSSAQGHRGTSVGFVGLSGALWGLRAQLCPTRWHCGGALWGFRAQLSPAVPSGTPVGLCVASGPSSAQPCPAAIRPWVLWGFVALCVASEPAQRHSGGALCGLRPSSAQPCPAAIRPLLRGALCGPPAQSLPSSSPSLGSFGAQLTPTPPSRCNPPLGALGLCGALHTAKASSSPSLGCTVGGGIPRGFGHSSSQMPPVAVHPRIFGHRVPPSEFGCTPGKGPD